MPPSTFAGCLESSKLAVGPHRCLNERFQVIIDGVYLIRREKIVEDKTAILLKNRSQVLTRRLWCTDANMALPQSIPPLRQNLEPSSTETTE